MVNPQPCTGLRRRNSAAISGWDRPLLTGSSTRIGFEHVAQMGISLQRLRVFKPLKLEPPKKYALDSPPQTSKLPRSTSLLLVWACEKRCAFCRPPVSMNRTKPPKSQQKNHAKNPEIQLCSHGKLVVRVQGGCRGVTSLKRISWNGFFSLRQRNTQEYHRKLTGILTLYTRTLQLVNGGFL